MKDNWNASIYSQFLDLRTRPAKDLLAAVPEISVQSPLYDLGCGPGNSTALLKARWPEATIIGIDSSADMIAKAKIEHANIAFQHADIDHFSVSQPAQLIFSNAALHWVCDHGSLIPKLANMLTVGGVLVVQIPNNFHRASHQAVVQVLRQDNQWHDLCQHFICDLL